WRFDLDLLQRRRILVELFLPGRVLVALQDEGEHVGILGGRQAPRAVERHRHAHLVEQRADRLALPAAEEIVADEGRRRGAAAQIVQVALRAGVAVDRLSALGLVRGEYAV